MGKLVSFKQITIKHKLVLLAHPFIINQKINGYLQKKQQVLIAMTVMAMTPS